MSWMRGGNGGPWVYIDGACEFNGQHGAKAGIGVYWGPGDKRNVSEALRGRQTNNRAEIQAAVRAIGQGHEYQFREMTLVSDSQFLINSATKWMFIWKQNGWITASGAPVENRADFEELIEVSKGMDVDYVYVKAYSGDPRNDEADRLAKEGIKKHFI